MFLVDTNIFLEVMLGQEKSAEVKDFFNRADFSSLFFKRFLPLLNRDHVF